MLARRHYPRWLTKNDEVKLLGTSLKASSWSPVVTAVGDVFLVDSSNVLFDDPSLLVGVTLSYMMKQIRTHKIMIYTYYNDHHILQEASQVILIKHSMILTRHMLFVYFLALYTHFIRLLYTSFACIY